MAKQFSQEFKALVQKNVRDNQPWYILADLRDLAVQKQEVQHVIGELMRSINTRGLKKSASLVSKALTKMQLKRMARESGTPVTYQNLLGYVVAREQPCSPKRFV